MFSQFRSAVEHLAQQQSPPANRQASNSISSQSSAHHGDAQRSPTGSMDESAPSPNSTPSQLAESALLNFRKTLMSSRSSSPSPSQTQNKDNSRPAIRSLEERLKASFTLGDASERTTPDASKLPTPGEVDPASVELPLSPEQELPPPSLEEALDPLGVQFSPGPLRKAFSPPPLAAETEELSGEQSSQPLSEVTQGNPNSTIHLLEASPSSIPLPESPKIAPLPPDVPNQMLPDDLVLAAPKPISRDLSAPRADSRPSTPRPFSPVLVGDQELDVEKLRDRLKLVEQRFTDVSTSFKRLQAEKRAADQVLKELTPLESMTDVEGLRDHLKNLDLKSEIGSEEIKRLNGRLQQHELRLEELRDMHRLETSSQSEQVERLRKQVLEVEALLRAGEEASNQKTAETGQLRADLEKARSVAKEEEEKRTKAISLLKTVRAKLVKAEKERDDTAKEAASMKEKEKEEKEKDKLDRARLELDLERANLDREREVANIRVQFEKELSGMKERFDRETAARKSQSELDAITTKAAHTKEITAKASRITALESTVRTLSQEKDVMFDQLQMRQAELESSQSHLDSVESRSTELQYQLREAETRIEILTEELAEINRKVVNGQSSGTFSSAEEVARILSETEGKYEARISDFRSRLRVLEKERHDAEDEWSRNLQERSRELERLRGLVEGKDKEYAESIRNKTEMENRLVALEADNRKLRTQAETEKGILRGLQKDIEWLKETETSAKQGRDEVHARLETTERQLEEAKGRENMLKASNKTLREELRKVQSSAALLERQRNPGIGYWSTSPRSNGFTQSAVELQNAGQPSRHSIDEGSTSSSPRPTSPSTGVPTKSEEEVNLEYLRNVILQFLEHKEMRPNLVRVLSIILHFTPQETRRLIAKV